MIRQFDDKFLGSSDVEDYHKYMQELQSSVSKTVPTVSGNRPGLSKLGPLMQGEEPWPAHHHVENPGEQHSGLSCFQSTLFPYYSLLASRPKISAPTNMDKLVSFLPSAEDGILPYYLLVVSHLAPHPDYTNAPQVLTRYLQVSVAAIGNSIQNLLTLHYTRRIYNGLFVPNSSTTNVDSVHKLTPVTSTASLKDKPTATDQVTPLAARLFGVYTILAGVIRIYGAYRVHDPALYQLCLFTHMLAAAHFTSEIVVFKTLRLGWEHAFPLSAGFGGSLWMTLQYSNYVRA